jgi:hypothetical protein
VRRFTRITIVILLLTLLIAAVAQLFLAQGDQRFPGPGAPTSGAP